ncbi:MAG: hypothetical protein U1E02_04800, partial [Hydrogenophaga sp.]|nr:hypothetical protein [Hydrogenophaga sp.]
MRYGNENAAIASGAEIGVGALSYTFAEGIAAETTRFELAGFRANLLDFIHIDGNIALESSSREVTLANGGKVATTALTVGGSDVNFFVGVGGAYRSGADATVNPDAVGLVLDNIAFGLALFSEQAGTGRSWSALSASASAISFAGLGDWLPTGRNVAVAFNQASSDGQVIDFGGDNAFAVPTGGTAVQLTMDGQRGALMRAEADVSLSLLDFAYFSGRIGFEKSTPATPLTVRNAIGVSTPVTATSMLAITGQNIDAFVGYADGGFDRTQSPTEQADNLYGFGVENLDLGILITKAGGQSYTAVKARMDDARLYGFDPEVFDLSAQGLSFEYSNKAGDGSTLDYAASFGPDGLALGSTGNVSIDLAAGERLGVFAETATLSISQFLYFSGAIGFEKADFGNALKAGATATQVIAAKGFAVGGSNITAFVGYAENGIDRSKTLAEQASSLYGFGVDGLDFALLSVKDGAGASYTALKAHADNMAVYGFDPKDFQLSVADLNIEYNSASVAGRELNFSGTDRALEVATGGDPMTLDFSGARIGVFAGQATLQISQFLYVQGALGFLKADFNGLNAATTLVGPTKGFAIGGANIDVFMGYAANGLDLKQSFASQTTGLYGFGAEGIDFGVLSLKSVAGISYTAAKAHADTIALYGFDPEDFELTLSGIDFQVNTASGGSPALNLLTSFADTNGYSLQTGAAPVLLDMTGETIGASMAKATLNIGGFVHVTGAFAFEKGATQILSAKTIGGLQVPVLANAFTIGASHVQAFVGVGGPYRSDSNGDGSVTADDDIANPEAIGLVVDDFSFGLGLFQAQGTGTRFTALKANANQIGFVGFGDSIQFNLQDVQVRLNQSNSPGMVLDFSQLDGGGLDIATGDPAQAIQLDFDSELIEATVGQATANVAGIVSLSGGFTFQKRMLDEVGFYGLGMNLTLGAEALVVAGQNVSAFAGINGPYRQADNSLNDDAIGFAIDDLDFALAMVAPSLGGGATLPLNFFGLSARAGYAGLVGTDPFLTLNATDVVLEFNGAMAGGIPLPSVYADFSVINGGKGLGIPIGSDADAINMSFDSNFLRVGMTATLGVFDLFDISTDFDFTFELPEIDLGLGFSLAGIDLPDFELPDLPNFDTSMLLPSISLSGLTDLIPDLSPSAPDWLRNGINFLRDINIRIGLDGISGFITLPDLSIDIGDFVYLNGDFKLTLGASFVADMATGIDPILAGATDLAVNEIANAFIPGLAAGSALKQLFNLSDDYSTIHDVTFNGFTLGASNVNLFVGAGGPDFDTAFSQQADLVGFGLQNLDIAIASFKADLPDWMGAKSVMSFTAHADELGVYGLGDVLKILGRDITVDVNTGGDTAFGKLLKAMPIYTSIKNGDGSSGLQVATGGEPVLLTFGGNEVIGLDIGLAEITVADFLHLRGSLAFRKGEVFEVAVDAGGLAPLLEDIGTATGAVLNPLPLRVNALTLGGANLTGFAGIGGPYRYGPDLIGLNGGPDGIPDLVNETAVGLEITNVDFGLAIMTPALLDSIPGLGQYAPKFVSGQASVGSGSLVGIDPTLMEVRAEDVVVNINTFVVSNAPPQVNAALQLFGPPSINYKLSPSFKDYTEDLDGDGDLSPAEDRNQNGKLDSAGFMLPAGGNNGVFLDFDSEIIQAKVGYAEINLGGVLQMSASMAFTKRGAESITLNNGEQTIVTTLAIGINDANAFMGIPVGGKGYFYDSNSDGRIDESDEINAEAIGFVIQDLDLGLIVAKESVIRLTGIDMGVYLAGRATVEKVAFVGVPGVVAEARELAIEINTGARVSIDFGNFVRDETTGAVSYAADFGVSAGFTTIDFSKSSWQHPDDAEGVTRPGYAIDTGNPREPIVLDYNEQFLRLYGVLEVDLFGLAKMNGVLDFRFSESEGLTAFADVNVQIGPDGLGLKRDATGLLVINSEGVALRLNLSGSMDFGPVAKLDAELDLSLNTFGREITYVVPTEFRALTGFDTFTISAYPPGRPDLNGVDMYVALTGNGTLDLMAGALKLEGDFSVIATLDSTPGNVQVRVELGISAQLKLPILEPLAVAGTLGIVAGSETTGIYGSLDVGGSGSDSMLINGGSAFQLTGRFLLQINTTNQEQLVRGRNSQGQAIDSNGNPVMVQVGPYSLRISGAAGLALGPVSMRGAVDLLIDADGIQAELSMTLDLGAFGAAQVSGAAAFGKDANGRNFFAMRAALNVNLGVSVIGIKAGALMQINTSSLDYTTLQGNVIKGGTTFDLAMDGTMYLLAFEVQFKGRMSVVNSVFKLEFDGSLNFFNALQVNVGGFVSSDGKFEFRGKAEINIYLGPLHLNAGMSVLFSSQPRFAAAAWGSLDFEIDFGLFEIDITLAGFRAEIDITPASAYMAAKVTVMGVTVSGSYMWKWGEPPKISRQEGDTLYLNMGDQSGRY